MPLETPCPGCGSRLRLPDAAAGRPAQCPECQSIFLAPGLPAPPPETPAHAADRWTVKLPKGASYGPAGKAQLDTWVSEGRVTRDCRLRRDDQSGWLWAGDVYPALAAGRNSDARPLTGQEADDPAAHANPYYAPTDFRRRLATSGGEPAQSAHSGRILLLGSLCLFCPILVVPTWKLGLSDLREIQSGRLVPDAKAPAKAGMILGAAGAAILLLILVALLMAA